MQKRNLDQTLDVIDFVDDCLERQREAKYSGREMGIGELIEEIREKPGVAFEAAWGSWDIPKELADLDPKESKILLDSMLPILKKLIDIFLPD